jgi:hypothetical protein
LKVERVEAAVRFNPLPFCGGTLPVEWVKADPAVALGEALGRNPAGMDEAIPNSEMEIGPPRMDPEERNH